MAQYDYNFSSRLLHRLALGGNAVAELTLDIERALYLQKDQNVSDRQHVFVSGLARAGTTVLMRQLYETGHFRSLTYRDMPFVLAPNLWGKISSITRKQIDARERAHGDGIYVDFDSPEALEEVFWRVACGDSYIKKDRLLPMDVTPVCQVEFRDYVSLILKQHHDKRYLSKNNNNVLRLKGLSQCFPNATIIIPFREPVQQACSLMRQHVSFSERHNDDPFSRDYMRWLVHHEFGQDHKPILVDEKNNTAVEHQYSKQQIGYWMFLWLETYKLVSATAPSNCIFVSYETLCDQSETVWPNLCRLLNLPQPERTQIFRRSQEHDADKVPRKLFRECNSLYEQLREKENESGL